VVCEVPFEELVGREVAQAAVPAATVIECLDVVEDREPRLSFRLEVAPWREGLPLKRGEEALGGRVIVTVTLRRHALGQPCEGEHGTHLPGAILAAPVRVGDGARGGWHRPERLGQGTGGQGGTHMVSRASNQRPSG